MAESLGCVCDFIDLPPAFMKTPFYGINVASKLANTLDAKMVGEKGERHQAAVSTWVPGTPFLLPNHLSVFPIFCYHVFIAFCQPRQLSINLLPQDPFYETPLVALWRGVNRKISCYFYRNCGTLVLCLDLNLSRSTDLIQFCKILLLIRMDH